MTGLVDGDRIDREPARDLLRRESALRAEAARVLADLVDLFNVLSEAGEVTLVGSSATGLMVRRDIDVCVICDVWNADVVFRAARRLASHPRVRRLSFRNEAGLSNPGFATDGSYGAWATTRTGEGSGTWTSGSGHAIGRPPTWSRPRS